MANASGVLGGVASGAATGASFGPWGAAIGAAVGGIGGLLAGGQKAPAAATYKPVDIADVSAKTIAANNANFGAASNLSAKTNEFNQSQASSLLEKAIPGFSALQGKLLAKVNEDLNGDTNLPADVQSKIAQFAAEKGVSRGTKGGFNSFNLVKDFGFNLVDYKNASRARALNTLSSVFNMTPRVNPMSPMASFVDVNSALGTQSQNNQMAFNSEQANNNAQTAASNYNRSQLAGVLQSVGTLAGSGIQAKLGSAAPLDFGNTSIGSGRSPAPAQFAGK